jgi:predicted kinase
VDRPGAGDHGGSCPFLSSESRGLFGLRAVSRDTDDSLSFYVIVRGPLGVGKSTVSERLAREVRGEPISIDQILEEQGLWESGRASEFLRANEFAAERAESFLATRTPVIFDGNFYWKSVIEDLVRRLGYPHYVFTPQAPLRVCIERDSRRSHPYGDSAARAVYAKTTKFDYGIVVDATGSLDALLDQILCHLPLAAGSGPM